MRSNHPQPEPPTDLQRVTATHGPATSGLDGPLDENLHHARAWHRYQFCYSRPETLRILDAGCGTGRSSLEAAQLNPGASVLGIDASPAAVQHARDRAAAARLDRVSFQIHDLTTPPPDPWGRFDFIVCRDVLGRADDPDAILRHLARLLNPGGLLLATFPSRVGRRAARALRQAIDALAPAGAGLEERSRIGLDLVQGVRADHPIASARLWHPCPNSDPHDGTIPSARAAASFMTQFVLDALTDCNTWSLDEAIGSLDQAGLRLLYAATPGQWQPDRALGLGSSPEVLRDRMSRIEPASLARLIDALDESTFEGGYPLYACPAADAPAVPAWARSGRIDPAQFERLIPHLTGLFEPDRSLPAGAAAQGRTLYRSVAGSVVELDRTAVLRLDAANGQQSCGAIDRRLASHTRSSDDATVRQRSWLHLVEHGLILLEPPDLAEGPNLNP